MAAVLAGLAQTTSWNRQVGSSRAFVGKTPVVVVEITHVARNAALLGRPIALLAAGVAPLAMPSAPVSVHHGIALIDTLSLLNKEVRITLQTLILRWPIAFLTVFIASLTSCAIDPKTDRAFRHARSMPGVVEVK